MSKRRLVAEQKRLELIEIINKYVNKEDRVVLTPNKIEATESFIGGSSQVVCGYEMNGQKKTIETSEAGVIGSIFDALVDRYSIDYKSLAALKFVGYSVYPVFEEKSRGTNSDAMAEVLLEVSSSNKRPVQFRSKSVSILRASVSCIFSCVEYYINCEQCFKRLRFLIREAQNRNRGDLAQIYVTDIAEMVRTTSYEGV